MSGPALSALLNRRVRGSDGAMDGWWHGREQQLLLACCVVAPWRRACQVLGLVWLSGSGVRSIVASSRDLGFGVMRFKIDDGRLQGLLV